MVSDGALILLGEKNGVYSVINTTNGATIDIVTPHGKAGIVVGETIKKIIEVE